jgi:hypothetical protein
VRVADHRGERGACPTLLQRPEGGAVGRREARVVGEVEIRRDGGDAVTGDAGLLAVFVPNERHEVRARTDARLLLVLAPWPGAGHPGARDD